MVRLDDRAFSRRKPVKDAGENAGENAGEDNRSKRHNKRTDERHDGNRVTVFSDAY
jgi:hypothetical protein